MSARLGMRPARGGTLSDDETAALLVWLAMHRGGFDLEDSAALVGWARRTRRAALVLEQIIRGERVDQRGGYPATSSTAALRAGADRNQDRDSRMSDLVETLASAAVEAIRNQATAITSDIGHLRSLTLELELANNGQVVDSTCWIEHRGVHRARKGVAT